MIFLFGETKLQIDLRSEEENQKNSLIVNLLGSHSTDAVPSESPFK